MIVLCGTLPCIDNCPDRPECIKAMAKAPTKVLKGIPIAGNYAMEDGKLVGKNSRKTSVSKHIQQRKSKKVRPTKRAIGGQRP